MKNGYTSSSYGIVYRYALIVTLGSIPFGFFLGIFNSISAYEIYYNNLDANEQGKNEFLGMTNLLLCVGAIIACQISPLFLKMRLTYKAISYITDLIGIAGCLISLLDLSITSIYIGRLLCGLYAGLYSSYVSMFVKEITPTEKQGQTGSFTQLLLTIGLSLSFATSFLVPQFNDFESFVNSNNTAGINDLISKSKLTVQLLYIFPLAILVIKDILLIQIKLNPPYYNIKEYETYFTKIYITEEDMHRSIEEIKYRLETKTIIPLGGASYSLRINKEKTEQDATLRRRLGVGLILAAAGQLSGINVIMFYSNEIFAMGGSGDYAKFYTVLLGVFQIIFTLLCTSCIQKKGRRLMLLAGEIIVIISLATMAIASYSEIGILSLGGICLHVFGFSISYGPITYLYIVEILEERYVYLAILNSWLFTMIVGYVSPFMMAYLGLSLTFTLFLAINLILLVFLYFFALETSGKQFHKIVAEYNKLNLQTRNSTTHIQLN